MGLTQYTSAAHNDLFERNIFSFYSSGFSTRPEYVEFSTNAKPKPWPTIKEARDWVSASGKVQEFHLQEALDAAVERVADRAGEYVRPVDANGDVDPSGSPVEVRPTLRLAALYQTHRWYMRKDTPQGVMGVNDFQGVIRMSALDPDIEALIDEDVGPELA